MNPYATHLPLLLKALAATSGDVLELGIGESSTPVLHEICRVQERRLVSIDSDPKFYEEYRGKYGSDLHSFYLADVDWDTVLSGKVIVRSELVPWSVVLVDHRPAKRRSNDAAWFAHMAKYVVCHDTEPENDRFYRWGKAFSAFKYRYDDVRVVPHTTVLSNEHDLSKFGER